jgi:tetratricopeptide (TPR) repeat protein
MLIELGRAQDALGALDELDAERGMTQGRRELRMQALAALGRWEDAHALLPDHSGEPSIWRLRADLLRRQGRFDEAESAYKAVAALLPEGSAPLRGLIEVALARGEAAHARALVLQRAAEFANGTSDPRDLGMLERVGLIERHFDTPRVVTLVQRDGMSGDVAFDAFARTAQLRPGQPLDVDLVTLAARFDCAPDVLERRLLDWHDQGVLRYVGSARDVLLELRPAADVSAQLDALLAEYAARQDVRVEAIAAYGRQVSCRHRAIAAHFGERLAPCGASCDMCAVQGRTTEDGRRRTKGGG